MNIFDIPELYIDEDFRQTLVLDVLSLNGCIPLTSNVDGEDRLVGTGAVLFPQWKEHFKDLYDKLLIEPVGIYLFFMDVGYHAHPHIDSEAYKIADKNSGLPIADREEMMHEWQTNPKYNAEAQISPHFQSDSYAGMRKTVIQIPVTPTGEEYARLTYEHESKGWTDHAFAFNVMDYHGVDVTKHMRMNIQIPYNIPINEFYELYTSGKLIRT